jgi:AcrR family transcriptional regulator
MGYDDVSGRTAVREDGVVTDTDSEMTIRPPRQERTRQSWARVLDAGVALVEEGGYEAFTIAAVCERAQVAPRAIYDRTTSKDALFLAVYEHGMSRLVADQEIFDRPARWAGLDAPQLVTAAVTELAAVFERYAPFLKSVVLLSGAHPEVYRRGRGHVQRLADQFTAVVLGAEPEITHPDPETAVRLCFSTVFAALVMRVSYGPDFAAPAADQPAFLRHLAETAVRYLLAA